MAVHTNIEAKDRDEDSGRDVSKERDEDSDVGIGI